MHVLLVFLYIIKYKYYSPIHRSSNRNGRTNNRLIAFPLAKSKSPGVIYFWYDLKFIRCFTGHKLHMISESLLVLLPKVHTKKLKPLSCM